MAESTPVKVKEEPVEIKLEEVTIFDTLDTEESIPLVKNFRPTVVKQEPTVTDSIEEADAVAEPAEMETTATDAGASSSRSPQLQRNRSNINASQIKFLVNFMERHPNLARSLFKTPEEKRNSKRLWNDLQEALNQRGPPKRHMLEWKKVWQDYKYNVKLKLRHNLNCLAKPGGNRKKMKYLNQYEESVVRSAGLNEIVGATTVATKSADKVTVQPDVNTLELNSQSNDSAEKTETMLVEVEVEEADNEYDTEVDQSVIQEEEPRKETVPEANGRAPYKTNKREKIDLLRRFVEAKEESNNIRRDLLRIKAESLEIKRKMYELQAKQFALTHDICLAD
ncbi:uncharacterized protein LOC129718797 isoform X1 [Wyeomyia smithii]|uniref:uncharacterized protein LOC129718797 isoform X1 n=1 Tax=Wyeomyia smithii TaxID=174621 RepID=UPI002468190F|nr:uncharacterized protein LOC129718797 isoform X1 [Wyeomyia smithii]